MGSVRGGRPRLGNSLLTDDLKQDDKWKFLLLDKQGPLLLYVNVCLRYGRWASGWASRQAGQQRWDRGRSTGRGPPSRPAHPALSHVLPVPIWKSAGERTISLARTFLVLSLSRAARSVGWRAGDKWGRRRRHSLNGTFLICFRSQLCNQSTYKCCCAAFMIS